MNSFSESLPGSPEAQALVALQSQMLRPDQNVNRDGGFELGWGVALLFFSFGPYLNAALPKAVWMSIWTFWIGWLPLFCAALAPLAVPKLIRRLITTPRVGYVAGPADMKMSYLIQLMIFGGALGITISMPLLLVSEIQKWLGTGPHGSIEDIVWKSIKLLVGVGLCLYLGPKFIRKSKPAPAASDAAIITEALKRTPLGGRRLRLVQWAVLAMFAGLLIVLAGTVVGLMYWTKSFVRHNEVQWFQFGMPGFLVGSNALLYLMGSGVLLKPHRWKWFLLPLMLLVPILASPAIPCPVINTGLTTIFDPLPPVMLCLGSVWVFSGTVTLILFISRNPLASAETT